MHSIKYDKSAYCRILYLVAHAHAYIDQFRDRRRERLISLLVLKAYFERTGQLR